MLLTIATIVAFQAYWLNKNYREEKRLFTIRTNLLFRETLMKLQTARLHLDSAKVKIIKNDGPVAVPGKSAMIVVSLNHNDTLRKDGQDSTRSFFYRQEAWDGGNKVYDFLTIIDSLQDSITVREVESAYTAALTREGIHIPFIITTTKASRKPPGFPPELDDNKVLIGFSRPILYQANPAEDPAWYLIRKISPQIFFSLLLVGVTIFSFLLLYRNWQKQRKLTLLKNDFISNITHELKTPIATVSVAVEALRNFNALQDPVRTREYLDISAGELQRLSLLVDKVLKLSMFERQEIELKNDHFDLQSLMEDVVASMRLQLEKYEARLTLSAQGSDFRLRADKLHITSVIFNLLDNALKYTPAHPLIQVELLEDREIVAFSVTDNGIGIPAAYRSRIFEKFFRVPTGDRHNVKGYGLGLSYVAYVLQRQGGAIHVESREGAGSRFTVKIPRNYA